MEAFLLPGMNVFVTNILVPGSMALYILVCSTLLAKVREVLKIIALTSLVMTI